MERVLEARKAKDGDCGCEKMTCRVFGACWFVHQGKRKEKRKKERERETSSRS